MGFTWGVREDSRDLGGDSNLPQGPPLGLQLLRDVNGASKACLICQTPPGPAGDSTVARPSQDTDSALHTAPRLTPACLTPFCMSPFLGPGLPPKCWGSVGPPHRATQPSPGLLSAWGSCDSRKAPLSLETPCLLQNPVQSVSVTRPGLWGPTPESPSALTPRKDDHSRLLS